ncbi:MAG: hypothetical protein IRZ32_01125 [Solirubrobacteraceae bacterium]|nr:hypothetical protein [Solirubrobacteraceae bacterium]
MGTTGGNRASGWVSFVACYLLIAGVLNVLWGAAALAEKRHFAEDGLIWSTLGTWGWIVLIVGVVQLVGAGLVLARRVAGAVIAASLGFVGLLANFLAIGAYPIWSVIMLAVNGLIVWAATVHSDEFI